MKRLVIASLAPDAGKTSLIVGLATALGTPFGYLKPLGDRLLYRKKRQWDYDAALVEGLFGLTDMPEFTTLGFDHAKLRYMYPAGTLTERLNTEATSYSGGETHLFIEAGRDLIFGADVGLDPLALARHLSARLLVLVSGDADTIADGCHFLRHQLGGLAQLPLAGVIANKLPDLEDFTLTHRPRIDALGLPFLGALPYVPSLTHIGLRYTADLVFARPLAGDPPADAVWQQLHIGTQPVDHAVRQPGFGQPDTLHLCTADRADLLVAALDRQPAGILLTDAAPPDPALVARAAIRHIPLLLTTQSLSDVARQLERATALLTRDDHAKAATLAALVKEHLDLTPLL